MAISKTVNLGGKSVDMRASALIPRLYRYHFGRDLVQDINTLRKSYDKIQSAQADGEDANFSVLDLTIFENLAWLMCKHADADIPDTPDEWLDGIDGIFDIYAVLPDILELWQANEAQTSKPKKK